PRDEAQRTGAERSRAELKSCSTGVSALTPTPVAQDFSPVLQRPVLQHYGACPRRAGARFEDVPQRQLRLAGPDVGAQDDVGIGSAFIMRMALAGHADWNSTDCRTPRGTSPLLIRLKANRG